jgi:hypothetical protein
VLPTSIALQSVAVVRQTLPYASADRTAPAVDTRKLDGVLHDSVVMKLPGEKRTLNAFSVSFLLVASERRAIITLKLATNSDLPLRLIDDGVLPHPIPTQPRPPLRSGGILVSGPGDAKPVDEPAINHAIAGSDRRSFCGLRSESDPVMFVVASG